MLKSKILAGLLLTLWLVAGCVPVQSTPATSAPPSETTAETEAVLAGIFIDPSVELGAISPYIFGSNYGPWVSLRPETLPLAEVMGLTTLRWPGGAWGDANTVTPLQVDQFVALARRLGAEPYIHVRFLKSTPDAAAELVRYANVEKGYNIRFWSIGNEPSLFEAAGDGWTAAEFAAEWRNFAEAMKAVDPSILLLGPEIHQFNGTPNVDPRDSAGNDWLRTFLAANSALVDVVTVHRYPFPNNAERTSAQPGELLADSAQWNGLVRRLREVVRAEAGRDLPVGVTEFNSHWSNAAGGKTTPDSFLSALWLGDVLARLIQERVEYANQFILASGVAQGHGIFEPYRPRPSYYVYLLYKQFGSRQIAAQVDDPAVTAIAAMRNDRVLTVMLINRSPETITLPLTVAGLETPTMGEVFLFDSTHNAEALGAQTIEPGVQITLPPESITLVVAPI